MEKLDQLRLAQVAQETRQTVQRNRDRIIVSLGSAAASTIPILPNHNIRVQEWGIDDPRTWPICLISIAAIIGLPIIFHKSHEILHGHHESEETPRGKRVSQIEAIKRYVDTGDSSGFFNCQGWNYKDWEGLSEEDKADESRQILLSFAGSIRCLEPNNKTRRLFEEFARKNPKSDAAGWVAFRDKKIGYVTQDQHEQLVEDVYEVRGIATRASESADRAHQRVTILGRRTHQADRQQTERLRAVAKKHS